MQEFLEAMALGVAEMRHFKRNRGSARRRVPKGLERVAKLESCLRGLTTLSNPPTKCLGVRWRILAHALGLNLDITSFTLVVH